MLTQSFRDWSLQMEELANSAGRADLAKPWLDAVRTLDPAAPENPAELARIAGLYRDYLMRCRQERHLCFVQPGRYAIADDAAALDAASLFFPLSSVRSARFGTGSGTMGAALLQRHAAYLKLVRQFHGDVFGRIGKQVLLVDLLSALQQGHEAFADLGLAIRSISDAFDELQASAAEDAADRPGRAAGAGRDQGRPRHRRPACEPGRPAARHRGRAVPARHRAPVRPAWPWPR